MLFYTVRCSVIFNFFYLKTDMFRSRDVKFVFFSKFEFQPLKSGLNLNFVYIFVEKQSNLHLMSALCGEMKVTACTPHAGKQSINLSLIHI